MNRITLKGKAADSFVRAAMSESEPPVRVQPVVSPLPCPFCGSTKITVEWEPCPKLDETDTTRRWFAECTQCSCQGPFCQKEPQVIPAWNKRANDPS